MCKEGSEPDPKGSGQSKRSPGSQVCPAYINSLCKCAAMWRVSSARLSAFSSDREEINISTELYKTKRETLERTS